LTYLPATLDRTTGCGELTNNRDWDGQGPHLERALSKRRRLCGHPSDEAGKEAAEEHGADPVARGTAHKEVRRTVQSLPEMHGVRCPPRTRYFRGLFLRADPRSAASTTDGDWHRRSRESLANASGLYRNRIPTNWRLRAEFVKMSGLPGEPAYPLIFGNSLMARKVVNRKELRAEAEAAEAREGAAEAGEGGKKKKAEKKAPAKRKSRSKTAEPERRKLFWGVFNQSAKRVALFDFSQRKAAEAKATELTSSGKNQHFVMKVKEPVAG
jgi:hypothetical protein